MPTTTQAVIMGRAYKQGDEAKMVDATLGQLARMVGATNIVLREPRLPTGFPDLVIVKPSRSMMFWRLEPPRMAPKQLKLLHHILVCGGAEEDALAFALGWSERSMSREVAQLCELGYLEKRDSKVRAGSFSRRLIPDRIMAVEAKLRDWPGAIQQASANTWFASESYVLVPSTIVSPHLKEAASNYGVGVIAFDGDKAWVASKAEERELPASYGSWAIALIVGQALTTGSQHV